MHWQQALWRQFADLHALKVLRPFPEIVETLGGCVVHHCPLKPENVPIIYGLPIEKAPSGFGMARNNEFPMSRFFCGGGCFNWDGAPQETTVLFCECCRALHRAWDRRYGFQTRGRPFARRYSLPSRT